MCVPKNRIVGSYDSSVFNFLRNCQTISPNIWIITSFPVVCVVSNFATCFPTLGIIFFCYSHPSGFESGISMGWCPEANSMEYLFKNGLLAMFVSSLEKELFKYFI